MKVPPPTPTRALPLLAVLALLSACGGGGADEPPLQPLAFTEVAQTAFSGVKLVRNQAVDGEPAWSQLWAEHTANVNPAPPRPAVDFSGQTVAAVFMGQTVDCRRPRIEAVEANGSRVRVSYRFLGPGPTELCAAVVTTPAHMVRFPNAAHLPVEFHAIP